MTPISVWETLALLSVMLPAVFSSHLGLLDSQCALADLSHASLARSNHIDCPLAVDDAIPLNASVWTPWTHPPHCSEAISGPNEKYCAYTAATSGPYGISAISLPEHAAILAATIADPFQPTVSDVPYEVVQIPGKGRGVVATREIREGEPIFADHAVLLLDTTVMMALSRPENDALLRVATDRLAEPNRVYEGARAHPEYDIVDDVIRTNAFHLEVAGVQYLQLFPEIALMNHDCTPNAFPRFSPRSFSALVTASRTIQPGEEITISYLTSNMPFFERKSHIQNWGFDCVCAKCTAPRAEIQASDERIERSKRLFSAMDKHVEAGRVPRALEVTRELLGLYSAEGAEAWKLPVYETLRGLYAAMGKVPQAKLYAAKAVKLMVKYGEIDERDAKDRLQDMVDEVNAAA